jgi:HlyD family secretion protein
MRLGEYLEAGGSAEPMMLFGDNKRLDVRVNVDEYDAWRIRSKAAAVAFVRGNPAIKIPLRFEYIEPYVVPKRSLSGQSTERTDTRVLQVIYSFEHGTLPVYAGQLLDVYIQAPPATPKLK